MNKSLIFFFAIAQIMFFNASTFASSCNDILGLDTTSSRESAVLEASQELISSGLSIHSGIRENDFWGIDGAFRSARRYERTFSDVFRRVHGTIFRRGFFVRLTTFLKLKYGRVDVLDLFGSGYFVRNPFMTSITGLRIGAFSRDNIMTKWMPDYWIQRKLPPQVLGDIFNLKTWENLDKSMKSRGIKGMNLVVMRPVGGWGTRAQPFTNAQTEAAAFKFIMENVLQRLKKEGRFYFALAHNNDLNEIMSYLKPFAEEIAKSTDYKLQFVNHGEFQMDRGEMLSGVLLPKSD